MPKKPKSSIPTNLEIEKALSILQSIGYKIELSSSEEDIKKRELSSEKLGLIPKKKRTNKKEEEGNLSTYLGIEHCVGGQVYGPGEIILPRSKEALFRSLIYQDNLARQAHFDTVNTQPISRTYIIKPGSGTDKHNKFSKVEVSISSFNDERTWGEATVTAGKFDIAGYNPNFNSQSREF